MITKMKMCVYILTGSYTETIYKPRKKDEKYPKERSQVKGFTQREETKHNGEHAELKRDCLLSLSSRVFLLPSFFYAFFLGVLRSFCDFLVVVGLQNKPSIHNRCHSLPSTFVYILALQPHTIAALKIVTGFPSPGRPTWKVTNGK